MQISNRSNIDIFYKDIDIGDVNEGSSGDQRLSRAEWEAYISRRSDLSAAQQKVLMASFGSFAEAQEADGYMSFNEFNLLVGSGTLEQYANNLLSGEIFYLGIDVGDDNEGSSGDQKLSRAEWEAYISRRTDLSENQQAALTASFDDFAKAQDDDQHISFNEFHLTLGNKTLEQYANTLIRAKIFQMGMDVGDSTEGSSGDRRLSRKEWSAYITNNRHLSRNQQAALIASFDNFAKADGKGEGEGEGEGEYISFYEFDQTLGNKTLEQYANTSIRTGIFKKLMDTGDNTAGSRSDWRLSREEWNAYISRRTDLSKDQQAELMTKFDTFANAQGEGAYISFDEFDQTLGNKTLEQYANTSIRIGMFNKFMDVGDGTAGSGRDWKLSQVEWNEYIFARGDLSGNQQAALIASFHTFAKADGKGEGAYISFNEFDQTLGNKTLEEYADETLKRYAAGNK